MTNIKSLDKLREKIQLDVNNPWSDLKGELLAMCDKVEREVSERFMPLPCDADGVPIRVGDVVAAQDEQPFEVRAFQLDALGWFAIERLGSQWNVNQLHHVKPRTLEDVLASYRFDARNIYEDPMLNGNQRVDELEALDSKVADEIRELMGVSE